VVAPAIAPSLLCDEMLGSVARWLRAAGHDAVLATQGQPDAELLALCRAESRVLVTRDRRLAHRAAADIRTVLLGGDDPDEHALAIAQALDLDWTLAPFSRCLLDNAVLRPANEAEMASIPDRSRALPGPFNACPVCGRVYWPGSHVKRMIARLQRWRDLAAPAL
jgi:uncharacterized protein with PIN domain